VNSRRWQNGLDGQGLVEYSLVLIFVALVIFSALAAFGPLLTGFFDKVAQSFPA
jgi:Flp pilus assembly pilin Flp